MKKLEDVEDRATIEDVRKRHLFGGTFDLPRSGENLRIDMDDKEAEVGMEDMVIDDDEEKFSRFTNNPDDEQKALMVINENNRQIVLLSIDNKLIKEHVGGICDCADRKSVV